MSAVLTAEEIAAIRALPPIDPEMAYRIARIMPLEPASSGSTAALPARTRIWDPCPLRRAEVPRLEAGPNCQVGVPQLRAFRISD